MGGIRDIVIRSASSGDVSSIFKIHLNSLEGLDEEDYEWFTALLRIRSRRRKILVAEYMGSIVGFIIAYKYRDQAYIDSLAVDTGYRGMGIGGKLLKGMEKLLAGSGVERVMLSVKKDNHSALGFYLKKGYMVNGLVLLLSAKPSKLKHLDPNDMGYRVVITDAGSRSGLKKRLLSTAWWSSLTEPVDKLIYAKHYREEYMLKIYRDGRLRGIAEYSPDKHIFIDYLAVSYHKPLEALSILLSALGMEALKNDTEKITIPIDATKTAMIRRILDYGYRVEDIEYRLVKYLDDEY